MRSRRTIAIVIALLGVCGLALGFAYVTIRAKYNGPSLGSEAAKLLNSRMRGRIEIGNIEWDAPALWKAAIGGWIPVRIDNATLWDDCLPRAASNVRCAHTDRAQPGFAPRKKLLEVRHARAEIDLHALLTTPRAVVLRNIEVQGGKVLLEQTEEPAPLHAYDKLTYSLILAFLPPQAPEFRAGASAARPAPIVELRNIKLDNIEFFGNFAPGPEGFAAAVHAVGVHTVGAHQAQFLLDNRDPLLSRFYLSGELAAAHGEVRILDRGQPLDFQMAQPGRAREAFHTIGLRDVVVSKLRQLPSLKPQDQALAPTLWLEATATTTHGGRVNVTGGLINYMAQLYGGQWALQVEAHDLDRELAALLPNAVAAGLTGKAQLSGPFVMPPKIDWQLDHVALNWTAGKLNVKIPDLRGSVDLVNDQGRVGPIVAYVQGPHTAGELSAAIYFGLNPFQLTNVGLRIIKPIDVRNLLPPQLLAASGPMLTGTLEGYGKTSERFTVSGLNLALGDGVPRAHIRGGSIMSLGGGQALQLDHLDLNLGAISAQLQGTICTGLKRAATAIKACPESAAPSVNLDVTNLEAQGLAQWAKRLGVTVPIHGIRDGTANISGELRDPRVEVSANVLGIADRLDAQVQARYQGATLQLTSATSSSLGGNLEVSGSYDFNHQRAEAMLEAERLDLAKLSNGVAQGTLALRARYLGVVTAPAHPVQWLDRATAYATVRKLSIAGEHLERASICLNPGQAPGLCAGESNYSVCLAANQHGDACIVGDAVRIGGGTATVLAQTRKDQGATDIRAALQVQGIPLQGLGLIQERLSAGGLLALALEATGPIARPAISGFAALRSAHVFNRFLGDLALTVQPGQRPDGSTEVRVQGGLHDNGVLFSARLGLAPPYPLDVEVQLNDYEVDLLAQQLPQWPANLHVTTTGKITAHVELAGRRNASAWLELDSLIAQHVVIDAYGRQVPVTLMALGPLGRPAISIHASADGTIALACRSAGQNETPCSARLATPAGVIELAGSVSPKQWALRVDGALEASLLASYAAVYVEDLAGQVELHAAVQGPWQIPELEAELRLNHVRLRPIGQDTTIEVPTGLIKLRNNSLGFTDVRLRVEDQYLDEAAELTIKGGLALKQLRPDSWGVLIEGQIAGKLLLALAPAAFSSASGVVFIEDTIVLSGKGLMPQVEGTLRFDPKHPFALTPRGVRHVIAIDGGSVGLATDATQGRYTLALDQITGGLDGEGRLRRIQGELQFSAQALTYADISIDAERIPFRSPGTLDLSITGQNLRLRLADARRPWAFAGDIAIESGVFSRPFELDEVLRPKAPPQGSNQPFWDAYPALGNADLRLEIDVRQFAVANNIASIDLDGQLTVRGTPRDPRLAGSIKVSRGTFRMQGTRAKFTRTTGTVDFTPTLRFPQSTPSLAILSEADFRDQSGQDHIISLELRGTLDQPAWDLRTSTGYNKAQTMTLLLVGKPPDQLRRSFGDQAIGNDPGRVDPSTSAQAGIADQIVKDLATDWVSSLFRSPLERIFRLDVFRIEVGFGSIGAHAEKRFLDNLRGYGDAELSINGSSVNLRGELRTPLGATLQIVYINKDYKDTAEQDIKDFEGKLVYRFYIP